jgi:hypothetical protein
MDSVGQRHTILFWTSHIDVITKSKRSYESSKKKPESAKRVDDSFHFAFHQQLDSPNQITEITLKDI